MVSSFSHWISHLLWMGAGAIGLRILQSAWDLLCKAFGVGFKESLAAQLEKGRPLTPEEKAELKKKVQEEIAHKLEKEADDTQL